jgi:hypothetical protein
VIDSIKQWEPVAALRGARMLSVSLGLLLCGGCVAYGYDGYEPYPQHGYDVPAGHLPPPGECRIWYPDRPAGQQPPPGSCRRLEWQVPPGAVLIRG